MRIASRLDWLRRSFGNQCHNANLWMQHTVGFHHQSKWAGHPLVVELLTRTSLWMTWLTLVESNSHSRKSWLSLRSPWNLWRRCYRRHLVADRWTRTGRCSCDEPESLPFRDHSGYGLNHWEATLHCNLFYHWLNPYPEWSLPLLCMLRMFWWLSARLQYLHCLHAWDTAALRYAICLYFNRYFNW